MEQFVKLCVTCSLRKPQKTQPPLRPIVANGLFSRVLVILTIIILFIACENAMKYKRRLYRMFLFSVCRLTSLI